MEVEQIEQNREAGGNTIAPAKQGVQHTYWCFTLNNYEIEQIEQIEQILKHQCKWYVFQEEKGESGTPHLQGTICLLKKQRLTELKKINQKIHWEATKCVSASIAYCTKKDSAIGKTYHWGINLPEPVETEEPRDWQLKVMDIINMPPDKRTIHWFWEPDGNVGKTTLCKYLVVNHNALMLSGKANDMFHMISKYPNKRKLILIDVPRSSQDFICYGAIEQIKNGLIFSGKYDCTQCVFNSPHVIVFANKKPDIEKMSDDRWNIIKITTGI